MGKSMWSNSKYPRLKIYVPTRGQKESSNRLRKLERKALDKRNK